MRRREWGSQQEGGRAGAPRCSWSEATWAGDGGSPEVERTPKSKCKGTGQLGRGRTTASLAGAGWNGLVVSVPSAHSSALGRIPVPESELAVTMTITGETHSSPSFRRPAFLQVPRNERFFRLVGPWEQAGAPPVGIVLREESP